MDGIHDLGGLEGFGPIPCKDDDQPFHSEWEKRVYGMAQSSGGAVDWSIDWFRFCRELIPPADYLSRSYFDHWLFILSAQLIDAGYLTVEELVTGSSAFKAVPGFAPDTAQGAQDYICDPRSYSMEEIGTAQFSAGDSVKARKFGSSGHTRLPGYVRGRMGTVLSHHGCHVLPDASARGEKRGSHLYTVQFAATELWPEVKAHQVCVDLWEDYLELV